MTEREQIARTHSQMDASAHKLGRAWLDLTQAIKSLDALEDGIDIEPGTAPDLSELRALAGRLYSEREMAREYLRELEHDIQTARS